MQHLMRVRAAGRRTRIVGMIVVTTYLTLVAAPSVLATPKGEFAPFADCPLSNMELSGCLVAHTKGGKFIVGKDTVPITNVITLQGGFIERSENPALVFVGAADGNTLSKSPQIAPAGLLGVICELLPTVLRQVCEEYGSKGLTEVKATTELAASASAIGLNEANLIGESGTAVSLPVKVKLENPFLGSNCYIGSNATPIVLKLTTGTTSPPAPNTPIKGKAGTFKPNKEGNILNVTNNSLVDNTFSAPGASGCGGIGSFAVDPAINTALGLPSAAGKNTAILNGTLKQAGAKVVREHE